MQIKRGEELSKLTTLGIGGPAGYLAQVRTRAELSQAITWAKSKKIEWLVIGEGSNLLVSDNGYTGLVIVNKIDFIEMQEQRLKVGSGVNLNQLIDYADSAGLAGMECLAGIPGSVGGAVYGNAGAYGQAVSDYLVKVVTLSKAWTKSECKFEYRGSVFKKNKEVIVEIEFELPQNKAVALTTKSAEIRKLREQKYPPGLKCPGSFFKNLFFDQLPKKTKEQIPPDKVREGKVSARYLLERVGAKGMKQGEARVANYHGNLIFNSGGARAEDVWRLAQKLQDLVKGKFGVNLEPEVQLVGKF